MAHHPEPWYRKSRGVWHVQIDGKQHNLGADHAVRQWSIPDRRLHATLSEMADDGLAVAVAPTGAQVITAGADAAIRAWPIQR
jgi:hypothetical protein